MWRDIAKAAIVSGFGSFMLISSSYAKELNFSFTSAVSYFGLIYLAVRFMYKSFLLRDVTDIKEANHVYMVREDEAIRMVKMILPYFSDLLFKLRSYFSGDPATTMKVALLFHSFLFYIFCIDITNSELIENQTTVSCSAIYFSALWKLHHRVDHGQIRVFWSIHPAKNASGLFISDGCIWDVLDQTFPGRVGVMRPQKSCRDCHFHSSMEFIFYCCSDLGSLCFGFSDQIVPAIFTARVVKKQEQEQMEILPGDKNRKQGRNPAPPS